MEDAVVILLACLLLFVAAVLPVGLLIWVYTLHQKVNSLQKSVSLLQVAALSTAAPLELISESAPASPVAAPSVAASATSASPVAAPSVGASAAFASPVVASSVATSATFASPVAAPSVAASATSASPVAASSVAASAAFASPVAAPSVAASVASESPLINSAAPASSAYAPSVPQAGISPAAGDADLLGVGSELNAPLESAPVSRAMGIASSSDDVTGFMLGNLFNKLGALVVIVAVGIFVKLIAPYVFFNAWVKLIVGYLTGTACMGTGLNLRTREKYRNYAEVLIGLGLAVNFIITYCSCTIFELWSAQFALLIATFLLVMVYALAAIMRRPSMLVLGLIAGYANLAMGEGISVAFLGIYILLLNAMTLMAVYRSRRWLPVTTVNLAVSLLVASVLPGRDELSAAWAIFECLGLWLLYVCFDIFRHSRGIWKTSANTCSYLNFVALGCFTGAQAYEFGSSLNAVGGCLLIVSLAYALLAQVYRKLNPEVSSAHVNMCLLALLVSLESFELGLGRSVLLVLVAWGLAARSSWKSRLGLANWAVAYLLAALWPLLDFETAKYPLCRFSECPSWMHLYLVQWGWPALGCAGAAMVFRSRSQEEKFGLYHLVFRLLGWTMVYVAASFEVSGYLVPPRGNWFTKLLSVLYTYITLMSLYAIQWYLVGRRLQKEWVRDLAYLVYAVAALALAGGLFTNLVSNEEGFLPFVSLRCLSVVLFVLASAVLYRGTRQRAFIYLLAGLGFLGLHMEALTLADCTSAHMVTGIWLIYAATSALVGMYRHQKDCTWVGIAAALATVVRLFMVDAADLAGIYKLLLFLAVGGALLSLSFLYTKISAAAKD